jgi:glucose-1-phosphate thymidylyltransferase
LEKFLREAPKGQDAPGYFLQWLLERREIVAFTEVWEWLDIGDRESYLAANLRANGGASWIHPRAEVKDSVIERSVLLGPCTVERAFLSECVVDEGVRLENVRLEKVLIGKCAWIRG